MSEIKYGVKYTLGPQQFDLGSYGITNLTPAFLQGIDKPNRLGNKIKYKFLQFRATGYMLDGSSGANPLVAFARVLIVQARVTPSLGIAAGPSIGEVFDISTSPLFAMTSPVKNTSVRVLLDRTYSNITLQAGVANNLQVSLPLIKIKKKVRVNNNVLFTGSAEVQPQDPKDNYYLIVIGDQNALNDAYLTMRWSCRISFLDT